jgi:hypothetical protein
MKNALKRNADCSWYRMRSIIASIQPIKRAFDQPLELSVRVSVKARESANPLCSGVCSRGVSWSSSASCFLFVLDPLVYLTISVTQCQRVGAAPLNGDATLTHCIIPVQMNVTQREAASLLRKAQLPTSFAA